MKRMSLLAMLALLAGNAFSQVMFTSNGVFTVPAGVTSVTVEVVGPGGNGAGNGGGGGGGGGYASGTFTVVPSATHNVIVGAGGSSTTTSISGLSITATRGANGTGGSAAAGGVGGAGSGGTINRTGGTGGNGTYTYFGGGGGGAGGPASNGTNGSATPPYSGTNCLTPGGAGGIGGGAPGGNGGKGAGFTDNSCNVTNPSAGGGNYGAGGGGGNGIGSSVGNGSGGYVFISWCSSSTAAPTGTAAQTFCGGATVANLTAAGTAIQWYAAATGGTALAGTTLLVNNTMYYASQTVGGCESATRFAVTATVNSTSAPTGSAAQSFCSAATIANLTATGTAIQWYAAATGGTALTGTTPLVNNTTYYASQTVAGCESTVRLPVTATVNSAATPTGNASQSFCSGATVTSLAASGTGIQWYAAAAGGTALAVSTPLVNNTIYYASQTVGGCQSGGRLAVTATVTTVNIATTLSGSTITAAAGGAAYQWLNCAGNTPLAGATSQSFTPVSNGSYAVIVTQSSCIDTSVCTTVQGLSLGSIPYHDRIRVYPNPASSVVTVAVHRTLAGSPYSITDAAGRTVRTGILATETTEIQIRDLASGVYHFHAGKGIKQSFSVVKQ